MTDRAAFLAAICAQPDDDTNRLVYADWLEEYGEPERAEFIRVQIRLHQLLYGDGEMAFLQAHIDGARARERELLDAGSGVRNHALWYDVPCGTPTYTRGFVSALTCTSADWLAHADTLHWHPGQRVECPDCPGIVARGRGVCATCGCAPRKPGSSGVIPRPCPETAQPVTAVTLTTMPELERQTGTPFSRVRLSGSRTWFPYSSPYASGSYAEGYALLRQWVAKMLEHEYRGITFTLPPEVPADAGSFPSLTLHTLPMMVHVTPELLADSALDMGAWQREMLRQACERYSLPLHLMGPPIITTTTS